MANCPWCYAELKPGEVACPECGQQAHRSDEKPGIPRRFGRWLWDHLGDVLEAVIRLIFLR